MKKLRKVLSAILAMAVIFSLVPAVLADGEESTPVLQSIPTPERIFAVVNGLYVGDYGDLTTGFEWIPYVNEETGEAENIFDYFNEDGTLTEKGKADLNAVFGETYPDEDIYTDFAVDMSNVTSAKDLLEVFIEIIYTMISESYRGMIEMYGEYDPELVAVLQEGYDRFLGDYPDSDALMAKVIADCFDGNENPDVISIFRFLVSDGYIDDDGGVWIYYYDSVMVGDEYVFLEEVMAPNGAYTKIGADLSGGYGNVYVQLKDMWEKGEISNEEAFAILFGYAPDVNGYLYSVVPEYDTVYDKDGRRVGNVLDIVNKDGTVLDSGLSVKDFVIKAMVTGTATDYVYESQETVIGHNIIDFFADFVLEYVPEYTENDGYGEMTDIFDEESAATEIDDYIAMLRDFGYSEEEIFEDILMIYAGYTYDLFGYAASGYSRSYLRDADGNKLTLADVMDEDGNFLYPGMGESIAAEMELFLDSVNCDVPLLGDSNGDGKINIADVSLLLKKVAKWEVELSAEASDANGDSSVNIADVSLMLKYVAGWNVKFAY